MRRFASGRATLEMRLAEPVELLRELEERAPFEFQVRDRRFDRLVLDVDPTRSAPSGVRSLVQRRLDRRPAGASAGYDRRMGRGRGFGVLVVAAALAAGVVGVGAGGGPGVAWTQYLPALPSPSQTHPNRVAHCKRAKLKCVRVQIERMRALQERLGCDHKAVFATTYLVLTEALRDALLADPHMLRWPKWFFREDALFANIYFRTRAAVGAGEGGAAGVADRVRDGRRRRGARGAGHAAGDQRARPERHAVRVAQLGLRDRKGEARKPDHDLTNDVLAAAYEDVVSEVRDRYDPSLGLTNPPGVPADDVAGLEMVRQWREQVWRNAERLVNAKDDAERAEVAADIQSYAAEWARGIAATPSPGYRAQRDAYCAQQLAG